MLDQARPATTAMATPATSISFMPARPVRARSGVKPTSMRPAAAQIASVTNTSVSLISNALMPVMGLRPAAAFTCRLNNPVSRQVPRGFRHPGGLGGSRPGVGGDQPGHQRNLLQRARLLRVVHVDRQATMKNTRLVAAEHALKETVGRLGRAMRLQAALVTLDLQGLADRFRHSLGADRCFCRHVDRPSTIHSGHHQRLIGGKQQVISTHYSEYLDKIL